MKARVDRNLCTGCELCVETCPYVFAMDDGLARANREEIAESVEESCRQAAEDCPTSAIILLN